MSTAVLTRAPGGRFAVGNHEAPGTNPNAARVQRLRAELFKVVTRQHMRKILGTLCRLACDGDVAAAKLILMYTLGPPEVQIALRPADSGGSFRALIEESFRAEAEARSNGHSHEGDAAIIDVGANDGAGNGHSGNGTGDAE